LPHLCLNAGKGKTKKKQGGNMFQQRMFYQTYINSMITKMPGGFLPVFEAGVFYIFVADGE